MPTQEFSCIHVLDSMFSAAWVAAKMTPPIAGRMTVWIVSLTVSIAGILSSTTSARSRTVPIPIAHQLSIHPNDAGRTMTSVNFAMRATTRKGM